MKKSLELLIIGGGTAGLTAAIYAARSGLETVIIEIGSIGGQLAVSPSIENYPGFTRIIGFELAEKMQKHAVSCNVKINEDDRIKNIILENDRKIIETEKAEYIPKAVIIATGTDSARLPVPEEEKFRGRGVHYCAANEAADYRDKTVAIYGSCNEALEEGIFLSKIAEKVIFITENDHLCCNKALNDELSELENAEVLYNRKISSLYGNDHVAEAELVNLSNGEKEQISLDAVFSYMGRIPVTEIFKGILAFDAQGYITTDEDMRTNIDGVFAAGDVRSKKIREITTAISDGTIAALNAEKYINSKC